MFWHGFQSPDTRAVTLFVLQRTLEFREDRDHTVREDVGVDVKQNYVRYHVKRDDSELWVINDFNRVCHLHLLLHSSPSGRDEREFIQFISVWSTRLLFTVIVLLIIVLQ